MKLILKTIESNKRSMFLYYPEGKNRTPFKRCSITVLRDDSSEASVRDLLEKSGLSKLAEENGIIVAFPNPSEGGWNFELSNSGPNDLDILAEMQESMAHAREFEPVQKQSGMPPSIDVMLGTWHPMNDTKYLVGVGEGASMALAMAACRPQFIAGLLAVGGSLSKGALEQAVYTPLPAYLVNGSEAALSYFCKANDAREGNANEYFCSYNPLQKVINETGSRTLSHDLMRNAWKKVFSVTRRTNTGKNGDVEPRMDIASAGFEIFTEDTRLGDQNGIPHTWFTHVPLSAKVNPYKKLPLIIFYHGGSDNPAEAADMTKFHELGEKEGFITVYPWGSNRASWNVTLGDDGLDDVAFSVALIKYMLANYPVDAQRVYLSGFSNGAAMAQIVAMTHPELVAAICPIDANWPGERDKPSDVDYAKVKPMALAMEKKKEYDYRIPMWYTYGTREPSYPVYRRCTQQYQYDFWKMYNNITVKPTPERTNPDPGGCGVPGDKVEYLKPSVRHPHHGYDVNRFFTNDKEPENYYNYVMMRDKGHEVAQMDPYLGWEYVKQFKRNPDGSTGKVK